MEVPLIDLRRQYQDLQEEIDASVREVLAGGKYILGPRVRELEERLAGFCGVKYGIAVASGSDALCLSLLALGVGPGDEVITTPFTFFATAGAITRAGATPVFADICPDTYNIDPAKVEEKINRRTRAVLPVHIFGQMADMDAIMELARRNDLVVIEDACQAIGSESWGRKAGSLGHAGCFSFFPTKNLGCCGDGGMVITSDEIVAGNIKILREHGSRDKFIHVKAGFNSRLDEIQAAVLLVKLKYLEDFLNKRTAVAKQYERLLNGVVATPVALPGYRHTYHLYVVRSHQRDRLKENLEKNGVSCAIYYPLPLHLQEACKSLGYKKGDFPEAEKAAEEVLAIPIYPELSPPEIERIAAIIRQSFC